MKVHIITAILKMQDSDHCLAAIEDEIERKDCNERFDESGDGFICLAGPLWEPDPTR